MCARVETVSGWWRSCLVADVGERVNRITAAGLTSRRPVQVPVSVLTLVTEDAHNPPPAGTLSRPRVTETGTPQRTLSDLCAPPVTGALWEIHNKCITYIIYQIHMEVFSLMLRFKEKHISPAVVNLESLSLLFSHVFFNVPVV